MKQKVYLVQPGYLYGDKKKSAYLPYAAGALAAYAFARPEIADACVFGGFICFYEDADAALRKLKDADVVGFSNYVWNYRYNCELAERLKQENPHCAVIFGGHQIERNATPLASLPFVDFLIFGEGEQAFMKLLLALATDRRFSAIDGISYRTDSGEIRVTDNSPCPFVDYPSPYLSGVFDGLLEEYPDVSFVALFETNRGCPFRCAYCDWGTTGDRIKLFPMERVRGEIEWFAAHRIESCFAADSNFGLFERDEEIARMLIDSRRKTGFPQHFDVTYAKSDNPRVLRIACALYREKMSNGPAISFQSLNPATLKAIGRENMSLETFVRELKHYEENGLRPYSELILGLPEETYDSFTKGIGRLLALGQHSYLDIFRCEILSNSRLADPQIRAQYGIETVFVPSSLHHVSEEESRKSFGTSEIVAATATMPRADMLRANLFSMVIQSCHHMGLTKYIAMYLFREKGVAYERFYEALTEWLSRENEQFRQMRTVYEAYLRGEGTVSCADAQFGNITWFPEELFFLQTLVRLDAFYRSLRPLVLSFIEDPELTDQLIAYQSLFAVVPQAETKSRAFSYDFHGFFHGETEAPLVRRGSRVTLRPAVYPDWPQCARYTVWYGRRRAMTDALVSSPGIEVE